MYDARLVSAAQEGDEAALSALYDRHADAVHDLCRSLTGDRDETARLVGDTFAAAACHLHEVSDPSQLRPWLLAIARQRILAGVGDATPRNHGPIGGPVPGAGGCPDEPLGTADLRRWTLEAACILPPSDRLAVDLQLRQGLDDPSLAAALGCERARLDDVLTGADQKADRLLGALVLARQGRRDCPGLAALLAQWDGTPTSEVAASVDRHALACDLCRRRRSIVGTLELLAAAPVVPAPATLRPLVLERLGVELGTGAADPALLPVPPPPPVLSGRSSPRPDEATPRRVRRRGRVGALALTAVAAVALGATVAVFVGGRAHDRSQARASAVTSSTGEPSTTLSELPTVGAPVTTPPTAALTTVGPPPTESRLQLDGSHVDLGSDATSGQVVLRNTGVVAADWAATTSVGWLVVSPQSGHLGPSSTVAVTFTVDRQQAPAGGFDVRVTFASADPGSQGAVIDVVGSNAGPESTTAPPTTTIGAPAGPVIVTLAANPSSLHAQPCSDAAAVVSATVIDPAGVTSAVVTATLPGGQTTVPMTHAAGSTSWSATLGPATSAGTITYVVTAVGGEGTTRTSVSHAIPVAACA